MFKKTSTPAPALHTRGEPWRVLVVDDEPEVHSITRLALGDCDHLGRGIEFLRANSAAEARALLARETGIALAYVDVVMEPIRPGSTSSTTSATSWATRRCASSCAPGSRAWRRSGR